MHSIVFLAACADLKFESFLMHSIVFLTACDDARIRLWRIPEGGLTETLEEPEENLLGRYHGKIYNLFMYFSFRAIM